MGSIASHSWNLEQHTRQLGYHLAAEVQLRADPAPCAASSSRSRSRAPLAKMACSAVVIPTQPVYVRQRMGIRTCARAGLGGLRGLDSGCACRRTSSVTQMALSGQLERAIASLVLPAHTLRHVVLIFAQPHPAPPPHRRLPDSCTSGVQFICPPALAPSQGARTQKALRNSVEGFVIGNMSRC
jgi:hypothetical protein